MLDTMNKTYAVFLVVVAAGLGAILFMREANKPTLPRARPERQGPACGGGRAS